MRVLEPSRQARRREASRRRILQAAAVVFARYSLAAPLEAVSEAAGCSKGGLYHHFPDRSRLHAALASYLAEGLAWWVLPPPAAAPRVTTLLVHLWAESCRRPQVRRRFAAAIRGLPVLPGGEERAFLAQGDQMAAARLRRLLVLGRLAQSELWMPAGTDKAEAQEAAPLPHLWGPSGRRKVGKLASGR